MMKKVTIYITQILIFTFFISISTNTIAQPPPPPNGGSNTSGNKLNGGGAPIGGGLIILLGLGAAYGGRKLYQLRKETLEE